MPAEIHVSEGGRVAIFKCEGVVTSEELINANAAMYDRCDPARMEVQLVDFVGATRIIIDSDDLRELATQDIDAAGTGFDCRIAIVAPDPVIFGVCRMWQVFVETSGFQTAVFRDMAEALEWLGLPPAAPAEEEGA
jgi:hypothetical protein